MQKNDGGLPITAHRMLPFSTLIGKHLSSAPAPGFEWLSCISQKGGKTVTMILKICTGIRKREIF